MFALFLAYKNFSLKRAAVFATHFHEYLDCVITVQQEIARYNVKKRDWPFLY